MRVSPTILFVALVPWTVAPAFGQSLPQECGPAAGLESTTWNLDEDDGYTKKKESVEFQKGGKLVYTSPDGVFPNGTWKQNGACVEFEMNEGYVVFTGSITDESTMEGTAKRRFGSPNPWRADRRGGAKGAGRLALAPGMPETLVRAGSATHVRVEEKGEVKSFSFTTDSSGRLLSSDVERDKEVTPLYDVVLYLDEAGARQAFQKFKAKDLQKQLRKADIHRAVLDGDFGKVVALKFKGALGAVEVRKDFAEKIGEGISVQDPAVAEFLKCVGKDYKRGDEVMIRAAGRQKLSVSVAGTDCPEIASPAFTRALLGVWIGADTLSGRHDGLLSEAAPLMKQ